MDKKEKLKKLEGLFLETQKKFGKDIVIKFDEKENLNIPRIPLESLGLTYCFGKSGLPKGRIIETYGDESHGKSSIAMIIASDVQKAGGFVIYLDFEHSFDFDFAMKLGMDVSDEKFKLIVPDVLEDGLQMVEDVCATKAVDLIIWDSTNSAKSKKEDEGEFGDANMGTNARGFSSGLKRLIAKIGKSGTTLILVSQKRCVGEDSYILTNNGLKQMKSLTFEDKVFDFQGNFCNIKNIDKSSVEGKEIFLKNLGEIKLSNNHKQTIINSSFEFEDKLVEDLKIGDFFIQPITNVKNNDKAYINIQSIVNDATNQLSPNSKKYNLPIVLNEDLAFFMGCFFSDGSYVDNKEKSDYRIQFTENNSDRYNLVKDISIKLFGGACHTGKSNINIGGSQIKMYLELLGMKRYGKNKIIPKLVLSSNDNVVKAFLRGAFFNSHKFDSHSFIFTCENEKATYQIKNLLIGYGINVSLKKDHKHTNLTSYNRIFISGSDAIKFNKLIGFAELTKSNKAKNFIAETNARGKYDVLPTKLVIALFKKIKKESSINISDIPYYSSAQVNKSKSINSSRLSLIASIEDTMLKISDSELFMYLKDCLNILVSNKFVEILNIKDSSFKAVDLEVDSNDSRFIVEGILTHNSKIGVIFGSPDVIGVGNAIKFYSSIRYEVRRREAILKDKQIIGYQTRIKCIKNKTAPPNREYTFNFYNTGRFGIDYEAELGDFAITYGLIEKTGSWYTLPNKERVQGKENIAKYYRENPKSFLSDKATIRKMISGDDKEGQAEIVEEITEKTNKKTNEIKIGRW